MSARTLARRKLQESLLSAAPARLYSPPVVTESSSTNGTFSTLTNPDSDGRNYRLGVWNSTGALVVTAAGLAEVLVVGGGGGGTLNSPGGAGGGAGGVRWGRFLIPAGTHTVTIGAGGAASTDGDPSSLGTVLLAGGGAYGHVINSRWNGTGGGGSGGAYNSDSAQTHSGGGAGGTVYGANSYSGIALSITGSSVTYGAAINGTGAGTANRGEGGGYANVAGGSGVVIIRWEI